MKELYTDIIKKLEAIIATAIDGIITIDSRGNIETINPAGASLFEYAPEEIIGENIKILMPDPYRTEHDDYLKRYQKTKKARIIGIGREVSGLKKSGVIFPLRLAVSEVVLNDKVVYTGIVHDLTQVKKSQEHIERLNKELEQKVSERTYELENVVNKLLATNETLESEITERKEMEKRLKANEEELMLSLQKEKELNELKSRFVSMASHEFRTPLASILSSAALIGRYPETDDQLKREKHIERIKSSVTNLTGILNDFLSLSKLEEGQFDVETAEIDTDDLCKMVISEMEGVLKEGQAIVHQTLGTPRPVFLDQRILRNILFNLLSNASKYSETDIACRLIFEEETLTIEIEDRGVGIPAEDQKYLFSRFFRAGNVTNISGTGLGLNIVKRYVDLLGGEIKFESTLDVGSVFTVILPTPKSTNV